jgi:glutathione S-transferase
MKLIYDPASTSSRIVTFFLHDQNIAFDGQAISIAAGHQHLPDLASLNPNHEVPVLLGKNGFSLTQSSAIIRYLAAKHELDVYPKDLQRRARVDEAISWFQTNFHIFHCALLSYTYILPTMLTLDPKTLATMRAIGANGSEKYMTVLNDHMIGANTFVCGDEITLADYVGAANVSLGMFAGMDFSVYPNVSRWLDTLRARKGWPLACSVFEEALQNMRSRTLKIA